MEWSVSDPAELGTRESTLLCSSSILSDLNSVLREKLLVRSLEVIGFEPTNKSPIRLITTECFPGFTLDLARSFREYRTCLPVFPSSSLLASRSSVVPPETLFSSILDVLDCAWQTMLSPRFSFHRLPVPQRVRVFPPVPFFPGAPIMMPPLYPGDVVRQVLSRFSSARTVQLLQVPRFDGGFF